MYFLYVRCHFRHFPLPETAYARMGMQKGRRFRLPRLLLMVFLNVSDVCQSVNFSVTVAFLPVPSVAAAVIFTVPFFFFVTTPF